MRVRAPRKIAVLLGLLLLCSSFFGYSQPAESVVVAVNISVSIQQLSPSQLRRIFTMRQSQWPNGDAITVFVLSSDNPYHQYFSKSILKLFPYQLDRLWNKLVYSGQGERPIEVENITKMQQQISNTPGAIGYLNQPVSSPDITFITVKEDE